jgi:hypothetical protein
MDLLSLFDWIGWLIILSIWLFWGWMLSHAWKNRPETDSVIDRYFWPCVVFFLTIFGAIYYYLSQYRTRARSQTDTSWIPHKPNPSSHSPQYPPVQYPPVQYPPVQHPPVQQPPIAPQKVQKTPLPKSQGKPALDDLPRQKLREIIAKYGTSIINDAAKVKGLLLDHCAPFKPQSGNDFQKEIHILTLALSQNIPQELLSISANEPFEFKRGRLQKRLTDLATNDAAAKWAVESWAEALSVNIKDKI